MRLKLVGDFAPDEALVVMDEIIAMVEGVEAPRFLIDHTDSPRAVGRETRAVLEERGRHVDFAKTAFFGMTNLNRIVARIIITILGQADRTKFFETEQEALAWIRE